MNASLWKDIFSLIESSDKINGEYLEGVGILGERLLILLNLGKVLQNDDMDKIGEVEQAATTLNVKKKNKEKS